MTRYVHLPLTTPRIQRQLIPSGFAGTKQTAAHVARLIREGAGDFYVRQKAIDILIARGVAPKDYVGEIDALFRWVQRHVRYTKDPFRVEVLHAPRRMLELRAGDCDDMTILLGALVKSIGHPVRLVLTGPDPRRPDLFSHIYLEAQCYGDWIPLDATMPHAMGWSPRAPVRLVLSIEKEATDDHATARTAAAATSDDARSDHTARDRDTGAGSRAAATGHTARANGRPRARVAPRTAAGDQPPGGAGARSTRESAVGSAAPPAASRAQRVDEGDAAPRVAARTRQSASPTHHAPDGDAAQDVGRATSASGTAPGSEFRREVTGAPPAAAAQAGDAAPRRHSPAGAAPATGSTVATDGSEARRTLNRAVQDASRLYRRFTRLPRRSLQRVAHPRLMPPVVVDLGQLVAVMYRSAKWVGHPRTYIHYMDDPPRLVSDVSGRRLFVIGGSYRITARGIEG